MHATGFLGFIPFCAPVVVTQPAPSENGNATIKELLPNWIRATPFLRGGSGVMHMKVRACELSGGCSSDGFSFSYYFIGRECYASLSQPPISWITTGGTLTVWVLDVPRRPSPIPHELKADDFPSKLESVLYAINIAPAMASCLDLVCVAPVCVLVPWS